MAGRLLVRDLLIGKQPYLGRLLAASNVSNGAPRLRYIQGDKYIGIRQFSVFDEFSDKIKGEISRNPKLQESFKDLKDKTEEMKGVKEDLKARTKQTTERLYKHVDGVRAEAEASAKKVYANVEKMFSSAKAEVKETLGIEKEESSSSTGTSDRFHSSETDGGKSEAGDDKHREQHQQSGSNGTSRTFFGKMKSGLSSKASLAFQKLKEAKPTDIVKKGYNIVKEELKGNAGKRKHIEYSPTDKDPSLKVEKSSRTDLVVLSSNQSQWGKKWDTLKEKMRGHPLFRRLRGFGEPVVAKSQEIAEDVLERWETSDHPVVHKIQNLNDTVFGESDTALSFKEIRQKDPSFSLPEFVSEVQDIIKPVLNAYFKGDEEVLKKYCSSQVIQRCKAEHNAFKSEGLFFDNKILHISEVEVKETKLLGDSPVIIVMFHTQQVYCVRDIQGAVTEGGQDTIHTVYYAWAMQQMDPEELGEGALYPIWRLIEMQQYGVQALI